MDKNGLITSGLLRREEEETPVGPPLQRVSKQTFLAVIWTACALSFCFVVFRIYIRIKGFRKLFADDYLVLLAWFILLTFDIIWQFKVDVLYWQYDVVAGTTQVSLEFFAAFQDFMPQIITWSAMFYCCLWSIKFSFLLFFRRLGTDIIAPKYWWFVTVCTACGLIACIGDIDYTCTLKDIMYIMVECPKPHHVLFENRTFYANTVADLFTDCLIMSIPIYMVWNTNMSLRKKLLLFGIFSVTIFIMATAIARVSVIIKNGDQLQNASIDWLYLWSALEMCIAIICACLGSFRQLYTSVKKPKPPLPLHNNKLTPTIGGGGSDPSKNRKNKYFLPFSIIRQNPFTATSWTSWSASRTVKGQDSMALSSFTSEPTEAPEILKPEPARTESEEVDIRPTGREGGWRQRWSTLLRMENPQHLNTIDSSFPGSQTLIASNVSGVTSTVITESSGVHVKTSYDVSSTRTGSTSSAPAATREHRGDNGDGPHQTVHRRDHDEHDGGRGFV
ncbi:hypothetical protein QBC37DRAFT_387250 [Rhypophila decipiens]|uniref:Rhodopsin domain-containing protein n=1 Tax=Rhypophila decipiens TaxID=261697 RepID=A0AAN6Y809_9PEZI|nr:hypothetical protein QBC37DRAFT_387250 [Rhypophila decipiens]